MTRNDDLERNKAIARVIAGFFFLAFAVVVHFVDESALHSGLTYMQKGGLFLLGGVLLYVIVGSIVSLRAP